MAKINILNVVVLDNPSPFENPFQFEITFECLEELNEDLEWKVVYVGSAANQDFDQVLDSVLVGPIPMGKHKFVFQADPPKTELIPVADAVGVTAVLLTCSYKSKEFIRVGYYVNNDYIDQEDKENPPQKPDFSKMQRNILAECPRVTKFKIDWDDDDPLNPSKAENPGEESENVPPPVNSMLTDSNQMPVELKAPTNQGALNANSNAMDTS
ncbi:histone chaperone ASF1A-like [Lingula anatina]|uniref:Histone chaperone ASF1A-like n=1 Tax=Lingula anatina TaxID=7574 RepID=A0A1S3JCJ4_LINAN|nr:histone chaperone ASF1A-like [Lingula anatina]|eukprot:XP_013408048.1 histone chaperone ASF1A-like [Lingula anatina]